MSAWLDDLSEDWPSQPPSLNVSQSTKALGSSTSRIPRPQPSRGSSLASRTTSRTTSNDSQRRRSVLGERIVAPNSINHNPAAGKKSAVRRSLSAGSVESNVIYSTVEVRSQPVSPEKNRDENQTPEWKKRLLHGDGGYGQQKDLFGPTGIQSLFQKPQETPEKQRKTTNLSFLKHLETIPSSPPASYLRVGSYDQSSMFRRTSNLDILDEADENSRQSSRQSNRPQTVLRSDPVEDSVFDQQGELEESSSVSISPDRSRNPSLALGTRSLAKKARDPSAQSLNDSFSAVFISKHNTADGGIAYAPIDMSRSELVEQLARLGMSSGSISHQEPGEESEMAQEEPSVAQSEDLPTDLPVGTPDLISIGEFVTVRRGGFSEDGSFKRRPLSPSPLRREARRMEDSEQIDESILQPSFIPSSIHTGPNGGPATPVQTKRTASTFSRFGENELDDHEFPEDFSQVEDGSEYPSGDLNDLPSRSPSPDVMPPGSQQPARFRAESPSAVNDTFRYRRKGTESVSLGGLSIPKRDSVKKGFMETIQSQPDDQEEQNEHGLPDSKRPAPSPFKNSTPKRRRTLLECDLTPKIVVQESNTVVETHLRMQSMIRHKRKDSRVGSLMTRAPPDILAQRSILRPRNPTPSQRRWDLPQVEIHAASDEAEIPSSSPRLQSIQKHLRAPLSPNASSDVIQGTVIASELAAFSEKIGTRMDDDSRKRSVTTQDFLDEAVKIMNFIRTKGKPASELSNVMESYLEDLEQTEDFLPGEDDNQSSFSRPPSREDGKGGWRSRDPLERTPSVLRHLEKYMDSEDDDYVRSSIASHFGQRMRTASRIETLESEPSGLEIIGQLPQTAAKHDQTQDDQEPIDSQRSLGSDQTTRTQNSGDSSLGRTTASRKSETVATIAPEAVASIIPESVAGYQFDKDRNAWVKQRRGTTTTDRKSVV